MESRREKAGHEKGYGLLSLGRGIEDVGKQSKPVMRKARCIKRRAEMAAALFASFGYTPRGGGSTYPGPPGRPSPRR